MYDFPAGPLVGQRYTDPVSGAVYVWNGYGWLNDGYDKYVLKTGDVMTGFLTLNAHPLDPFHAATKQFVTDSVPAFGTYVQRAGDTMLGYLNLSADPAYPMHAATKQYVDATLGDYLPLTGGQLSGFLTLHANPSDVMHAATKMYVDSALGNLPGGADLDLRYVIKSGDTMTGNLFLPAAVTDPMHAAHKQYVDQAIAAIPPAGLTQAQADALYVNITGDTMTGALYLPAANPAAATEAAHKQYVDSAIAAIPPALTQATADGLYVNVTGDTMSGPLQINSNLGIAGNTSLQFASTAALTAYGVVTVLSNRVLLSGGGPTPSVTLGGAGLYSDGSGVHMGNHDGAGNPVTSLWRCNGTGQWAYSAQAYKPGGGAWFAASDARIKTVHSDYTKGLEAIKTLRPVQYSYKGNDTLESPTHVPVLDENNNRMPDPETTPVAPYGNSQNYSAASTNQTFIGLVAQETEATFPEMITQSAGFIDGQPVSDLRIMDPNALTYALINAVKELSAKVEALEAQLAAQRK